MEQSPASKNPSLSYGVPDCPSCGKPGLVLIDKEHVACIVCDYKRDFSQPLKRTKGSTPIKRPFLWLRTQVFQRAKKVYGDVTSPQSELNERDFSDSTSNDQEQQKELLLATEISENVSTGEVAAELATLCKALNAYHIACGGNGLEIDDWETLVAVRELARV